MMRSMKNADATLPQADVTDVHAEQLTLLPHHEVPTRFRLPDETRRRGLQHVAEIRQMLASREADALADNVHRLPPRTKRAA
jgi:hypothetical protein